MTIDPGGPQAPPSEDQSGPIARLIGLANCFEISLAALNLQIARASGSESTNETMSRARDAAVRVIGLRQEFRRLIGSDLMQDAAFDILLELFAMQVRQQKTGVMDICAGLDFPSTTTRRWLHRLEQAGLIWRFDDPGDHRRDWVNLHPDVFDTLGVMLDASFENKS